MSFGFTIASQVFERWMDKIFKDFKDFCLVYLDNILVFFKTIEEHRKHFKFVCEKFQKNEIICYSKKIESTEFLGLVLN